MHTSRLMMVTVLMAVAGLGCGKKEEASRQIQPVKTVPSPVPSPPETIKPMAPPGDERPRVVQPASNTHVVVQQPIAKPNVKSEVKLLADPPLDEPPKPKDISGEQTPEFAVKPKATGEENKVQEAYGSLFAELNLAEKEEDALKKLLVGRDRELAAISAEHPTDLATLEQLQSSALRSKEQRAAFDKDLETLLGKEKFAQYQAYEASEPQRTQVGFFKNAVRNMPLTEDQERNLVAAMVDARKAFRFSHDYEIRVGVDPEIFTDEGIAKHLQEFAELQARYLDQARTLLSPEQLAKFKEDQVSRMGTEHMRVMGMAQRYRRAIPK